MNEAKLRILHLITGLSIGGAERALYSLLTAGLAERFDSHVISLGDEGKIGAQIQALGVPVTALGMSGGLQPIFALRTLRQVVREFQPDIIQGWMYHGNLAATMGRALVPGCPVLIWNIRHSLYDLRHEKPMTRQVIRANRFFSSTTDAILYNSRISRQQHESFGFASRNGQVIPNGVDIRRFSYSEGARHRVRSELAIPVEATVVGHMARLHPMKDHPVFLRVGVRLAIRYPKIHFLLCGRNVSLENDRLSQLIPDQVRSRFHLLGERSDVPELMSAMDIFCQSSWSEAFPNVLCEAMAVGIPCVATDVGDSATIIGDTGVVVQPRDKKALVEGIESILAMSSGERRVLGARARDRIKANYTLGVIMDQYAALYEQLGSEKRRV